jgi:RNA polymerase sigma-70 factor (ECF subfamily)
MTNTALDTTTPDRAFRDDFAGHYAFVRGRLHGLGVSAGQLDDATQNVFEVFLRRVANYDPDRPLRNWLAGIARRVARRHRDGAVPGVLALDESRAVAPAPTPEHRAELREQWAILEAFLGRLDHDRWEVFVLSEIEGLRGTEIAVELGVALNTVYARLRSAHRELDRTLRRHRAGERRGLAAWLPVGWTTSVPLRVGLGVGIIALAVGTALSVRACAHDDMGPAENPTRSVLALPATPPPPPVTDARGVGPRQTDPAVESRPEVVADPDGWHAAGTSLSEGGGALSVESRYRLDGDTVEYEMLFIGDDDVPTRAIGHLQLHELELLEGSSPWDEEVPAGGERTLKFRLRATTPGVVEMKIERYRPEGRRPHSQRQHRWHFADGELRMCTDDCDRIAATETLAGETVTVHLVNNCDVTVRYVLWGHDTGEVPPADAPVHTLDRGVSVDREIDVAQWFHRVDDTGVTGMSVQMDEPGTIELSGPGCSRMSTRSGGH